MKKRAIKILIALVIYTIAIMGNFGNIWIKDALFIISYLIVGFSILKKAIRNIFRGKVFDENFLMAVATIGAFGVGEFPEAVAVMLFYQIGELFQSYAVDKSRKSISSLMDIRPDYFLFRFLITKLNLKTLGREDNGMEMTTNCCKTWRKNTTRWNNCRRNNNA